MLSTTIFMFLSFFCPTVVWGGCLCKNSIFEPIIKYKEELWWGKRTPTRFPKEFASKLWKVKANDLTLNDWANGCSCWTNQGINLLMVAFLIEHLSGKTEWVVPPQAFKVCQTDFGWIPSGDFEVVDLFHGTCNYHSYTSNPKYCARTVIMSFPEPVYLLAVSDVEAEAQLCHTNNHFVWDLEVSAVRENKLEDFPNTGCTNVARAEMSGTEFYEIEFHNVPIPTNADTSKERLAFTAGTGMGSDDKTPKHNSILNAVYRPSSKDFDNPYYSVLSIDTINRKMKVLFRVPIEKVKSTASTDPWITKQELNCASRRSVFEFLYSMLSIKTRRSILCSEGTEASFVSYSFTIHVEGMKASLARPNSWWDKGNGKFHVTKTIEMFASTKSTKISLYQELNPHAMDEFTPMLETVVFMGTDGYSLGHQKPGGVNGEECNSHLDPKWRFWCREEIEYPSSKFLVRKDYYLPKDMTKFYGGTKSASGQFNRYLCVMKDGKVVEKVGFDEPYEFAKDDGEYKKMKYLPYEFSMFLGKEELDKKKETEIAGMTPNQVLTNVPYDWVWGLLKLNGAAGGTRIDEGSIVVELELVNRAGGVSRKKLERGSGVEEVRNRGDKHWYVADMEYPIKGAKLLRIQNVLKDENTFYRTVAYQVEFKLKHEGKGRRDGEEKKEVKVAFSNVLDMCATEKNKGREECKAVVNDDSGSMANTFSFCILLGLLLVLM